VTYEIINTDINIITSISVDERFNASLNGILKYPNEYFKTVINAIHLARFSKFLKRPALKDNNAEAIIMIRQNISKKLANAARSIFI
jgi:hypothetical protein